MKKSTLKLPGTKFQDIEFIYNNFKNGKDGLYVRAKKTGKKGKSDFLTNTKTNIVDSVVLHSSNNPSVSIRIASIAEWRNFVKYVEKRIKQITALEKRTLKKGTSRITAFNIIAHPTPDLCIIIESKKDVLQK